jgi:D-methionine transport system permease protein
MMKDLFEELVEVNLLEGLYETLYMVGLSTFFACLLGTPLGVILVLTDKNGIKENRFINTLLGGIVNIGRSIPFIILMVALIPLTMKLIGTSIGPTATVVSLTVAAIPFFARLLESNLKEVDHGVIDASVCMGASTFQVVMQVYLKESLPSIVRSISIVAVNLVGYSAMAGALGGGGLGDIAIRYGYYLFNTKVMLVTLVIIIILVQVIQMVFDVISKKINKI